MQNSIEYVLETRFWAFCFLLPFSAASIAWLVSASSAKSHSKKFWAPLNVVAELFAALTVSAAVSVAAQYYIKQHESSIQKNYSEATHKRQSSAFNLSIEFCKIRTDSALTFRESSARAQLCNLGLSFSQTNSPALDQSLMVLTNTSHLINGTHLEITRIEQFKMSVSNEIDASRTLRQTKSDAETRPEESGYWIFAIALSAWIAAMLKFSRAICDWRGLQEDPASPS